MTFVGQNLLLSTKVYMLQTAPHIGIPFTGQPKVMVAMLLRIQIAIHKFNMCGICALGKFNIDLWVEYYIPLSLIYFHI